AYVAAGKHCPRKFLINANVALLDLPDSKALDNVNTVEEARAAHDVLGAASAPGTDARTPVSVRVHYYALFREQAQRSEEQLDTAARTPAELYHELQARYPFRLAPEQLKVAINSDFSDWNATLRSGDTVVFIPPVAGG